MTISVDLGFKKHFLGVASKSGKCETRIVGFPQSMNGRKDENPRIKIEALPRF